MGVPTLVSSCLSCITRELVRLQQAQGAVQRHAPHSTAASVTQAQSTSSATAASEERDWWLCALGHSLPPELQLRLLQGLSSCCLLKADVLRALLGPHSAACAAVRVLDLSGNALLSGQGVADCVTRLPCTTSLNLSMLGLRDADICTITHTCCGTRLKTLQLEHCVWLTDAAVCSLGGSCPNLGVLDLSGCWRITRLEPLASCVTLRSLQLRECWAIPSAQVSSVLGACTRLSHLNVAQCIQLDSTFLPSPSQQHSQESKPSASFFSSLTSLDISGTQVGPATLPLLAFLAPQLSHLNVFNCANIGGLSVLNFVHLRSMVIGWAATRGGASFPPAAVGATTSPQESHHVHSSNALNAAYKTAPTVPAPVPLQSLSASGLAWSSTGKVPQVPVTIQPPHYDTPLEAAAVAAAALYSNAATLLHAARSCHAAYTTHLMPQSSHVQPSSSVSQHVNASDSTCPTSLTDLLHPLTLRFAAASIEAEQGEAQTEQEDVTGGERERNSSVAAAGLFGTASRDGDSLARASSMSEDDGAAVVRALASSSCFGMRLTHLDVSGAGSAVGTREVATLASHHASTLVSLNLQGCAAAVSAVSCLPKGPRDEEEAHEQQACLTGLASHGCLTSLNLGLSGEGWEQRGGEGLRRKRRATGSGFRRPSIGNDAFNSADVSGAQQQQGWVSGQKRARSNSVNEQEGIAGVLRVLCAGSGSERGSVGDGTSQGACRTADVQTPGILRSSGQLRSLCLSHSGVDDRCLSALSGLTSLDLRGCQRISDNGLLQALLQSPGLQVLKLSGANALTPCALGGPLLHSAQPAAALTSPTQDPLPVPAATTHPSHTPPSSQTQPITLKLPPATTSALLPSRPQSSQHQHTQPLQSPTQSLAQTSSTQPTKHSPGSAGRLKGGITKKGAAKWAPAPLPSPSFSTEHAVVSPQPTQGLLPDTPTVAAAAAATTPSMLLPSSSVSQAGNSALPERQLSRRRCPELLTLSLPRGCGGCVGWIAGGLVPVHGAGMCTQLQKVEVAGAKAVTDEALQLLGCACPCLRQLTLKGAEAVTDAGAQSVLSSCLALRRLIITGSPRISDTTLAAAMSCSTRPGAAVVAEERSGTEVDQESSEHGSLVYLDLSGCAGLTGRPLVDSLSSDPPLSVCSTGTAQHSHTLPSLQAVMDAAAAAATTREWQQFQEGNSSEHRIQEHQLTQPSSFTSLVDAVHAARAARSPLHLLTLKLSSCKAMTPQAFVAACVACPHLNALHAQDTAFSQACFEAAAAACPGLTVIEIGGTAVHSLPSSVLRGPPTEKPSLAGLRSLQLPVAMRNKVQSVVRSRPGLKITFPGGFA